MVTRRCQLPIGIRETQQLPRPSLCTDIQTRFRLGEMAISYRPLFQQKLENKQKTENFLRDQLKAGYKLSEKFSLFALTENCLQLNHGFKNHARKYAFGSEFELAERSDLEFQFTVEDRIGEK